MGLVGLFGPPDSNVEEEQERKVEEEVKKEDPYAIYDEFVAAEYSACRMNYKFNSFLASAGAAIVAGMATSGKEENIHSGAFASPLDDWSIGAFFAWMPQQMMPPS